MRQDAAFGHKVVSLVAVDIIMVVSLPHAVNTQKEINWFLETIALMLLKFREREREPVGKIYTREIGDNPGQLQRLGKSQAIELV